MSSQGKQVSLKKARCTLNPLITKTVERVGEPLSLPPGFLPTMAFSTTQSLRDNESTLIVKRSWDIALGPLKQIPMNLFIMYMAGDSISIFPLMMVGMLFLRPIKALIAVNATFAMITGTQAILQKLVYVIGNLATVALALYKCSSMGLLPTYASDWLDFVEPAMRAEYSGGGLSLS
ncbi:ER membrane protein complex subunit 4-like [Varroa jacobsoni]|uniref:ER membrane protein complex subunit 4 n=1 Tax=Varroa destructor TaxID=109461 RepID=A0A7M7JAE8_VARDE|nr:ER membrane protein complex subunit 4-like [Varroa destructor]XP_022686718.1 ER membrane protein complex subunit 4-like [Varroa jacobsoni]